VLYMVNLPQRSIQHMGYVLAFGLSDFDHHKTLAPGLPKIDEIP
jgi:hypothetical protein